MWRDDGTKNGINSLPSCSEQNFYYHMWCLSALQIELMQIDWTIHHLLLKFAWAENFAFFELFLFERNTCTYAPVIKDASALWFIGTQAVFGWELCITALVLRFVKCINSTCLGSKNTSFNFNWGKKKLWILLFCSRKLTTFVSLQS